MQEEDGSSGLEASARVQKHGRAVCRLTLQHRQVHGIVGFLRDAEHHFQPVLDLTFTFLAARQQLLGETDVNSTLTTGTPMFYKAFAPVLPFPKAISTHFTLMLYLEKQLVLCDSLHWLDQVRGDGVSKAMSLLDLL